MGEQTHAPGPGHPTVIVPMTVAERFTREIHSHPKVEVGGKYLGFVRGEARCATTEERLLALSRLTFEITDYLDDGPKAERTPSYHRGDARWQTAEFRKHEARDPDIEQLGSWHSHHPNGLRTLSSGDIRGYQETVDDPGHNHDFFFVSLGVDLDGFATAKHYVFVRGSWQFFEVPPSSIRVVRTVSETAAKPPAAKGEAAGSAGANADVEELSSQNKDTGQQQNSAHVPPIPKERGKKEKHAPAGQSYQRLEISGWSDTADGRRALTDENRLLDRPEFEHVQLSAGRGRLLARGWFETKVGRVSVSLVYPTRPWGEDGLLKLVTLDGPIVDVALQGRDATGLDGVRKSLKYFVDYVVEQVHGGQRKNPVGHWLRNRGGRD
jgi:hypothetical protein